MRARFKDRLITLHNRCRKKAAQLSIARTEIRRLRQRRDELLKANEDLKSRHCPIKIKGHTYPAQLVVLAVYMIVQAGCSLRATAKTVGFVSGLLGWSFISPSHVTVGRWVLRCGLARLQRIEDLKGPHMLILDESVQIGREKLLLLLAVPAQRARQITESGLTHQDVIPIGMRIARSWTGDKVADFIAERLQAIPGLTITYAISDGGPNLLRGLKLSGIKRVADCTHVMMNLVQTHLGGNKVLSQINHQHSQLRSKWLMTDQSYLVTTTIRYKDRITKLFALAKWIERIQSYWPHLTVKVREQLHFVQTADQAVEQLKQVKYLFEQASGLLKTRGIHQHSRLAFWMIVEQYRRTLGGNLSAAAQAFADGLLEYMENHLKLFEQTEPRLLCCSDVIESIFGKYKNKGGVKAISGDVLGIMLYGVKIDPLSVKEMLEEVNFGQVQTWLDHNTCPTRYTQMAKRRRTLKSAA